MRMNTKIEKREHLGWLCNQFKVKKAVEIGTHQGVFADLFLDHYFGKLICVDPWKGKPTGPDEIWYPCFIKQNLGRTFDRKLAEFVLEFKYRERVSFLPLESLVAAKTFRDSEFGFVYIDAKHDKKSVSNDIEAWWPKLKPGGIMAGHDYYKKDPVTAGVAKAVDAFAEKKGVKLYVTGEIDYPSWYFRKR